MATTFELIQSQANQIYDKIGHSSVLQVEKGVNYILDFINDKMKLLNLEDVVIKIEEKKESPFISVKWRIFSFVIHDQSSDFSVFSGFFDEIIEHYRIFNDSKTEKLFLDETIRVETKENKIIFISLSDIIPNRIEIESKNDPYRFIVKIYQVIK